MKKKLLIIIAIVLVVAVSVTLIFILKPKEPTPERGEFDYRNYNRRYDNVSFTVTPIDAEIAGGNDVAAVLHLLSVANSNVIAANYLASASTGDGSAGSSLLDMNGTLEFGDIYIRDNGAFYSQSVARITEATSSSPIDLLGFAQALLDQADRKYSADGETFYVQKVKGMSGESRMILDYPYGSAEFSEGAVEQFTLEQYKEEEYVKEYYNELSNFVFAEDTILPDNVVITYVDGLYTCNFEVNLVDIAARDKATEFSRANMREASDSDDLQYVLYKVTIEIYDNGLIKKYTKEESWEATLNLPLGLSPHGSSHSITSVFYSWDPDDCSFETMGIDTSWISG